MVFMKKIPTLFQRDPSNRSRVIDIVNPVCQWVLSGEGWPTRKLDGTCCMIADGILWKRRELKKGVFAPEGFRLSDHDERTGKTVGWLPVGDGPEDALHREAFAALPLQRPGTYELIGPKVQGNPEGCASHTLVAHDSSWLLFLNPEETPRTFSGLQTWFAAGPDIEGVVWRCDDGRMAKIKLRDFGFKRGQNGQD